MFFSIIVPVYNVEKYLAQCIESVLCQTFADYELILVDDGSTDNSPKICDAFAAKDNRIKVIHKENGGLSDARNIGTKLATGKYIIYLDSDDFIVEDTFFAGLFAKAEAMQSDLILYKFSKYFDETCEFIECPFSFEFLRERSSSSDLWYELVKHDAYYGMAWIKAIRREVIVSHNIEFQKGLTGEDMDWYFHLVHYSKSVSFIDKAYIAYRQRSGSITSSIGLKNLTDFIFILEKWSKKVLEGNVDKKTRMAIMGALAKYYSNLLITYTRLKDKNKKQYKSRVKALSYLLNFSLSARPQKIREFYKLVGFGGVVLMLKIYDKIK